jgi:hypothetical protein
MSEVAPRVHRIAQLADAELGPYPELRTELGASVRAAPAYSG